MNYKTWFNRLFGRFERTISENRLRLFKTLYVNFRLLPFNSAIKLPIFIYGKTKIVCLNGKVLFEKTSIHRGMIKLGRLNNYYSNANHSTLFLSNNSIIRFQGNFIAANGYIIHLKDKAELTIGDCVSFGDNVSVICSNRIKIGAYSQITFNSYIVDSNFHYTIDLEKNSIARREGSVCIGERNWVGNSSYLAKGTCTGNGCVIGAGSYLNKNYTEGDNLLIVGRPATIKRYNYTRVLSFERESEIEQLFSKSHQDMIEYNKVYIDPYEDVRKFFV